MQYRNFGKLNWKVSALSLGIAGLAALQEDDAVKVVRTAVDSGVNLIDVGWPLAVKSLEPLFAPLEKALKDGYGQKIKICATIPVSKISEPADFNLALSNLCRWLRTDHIDFLLLGGLNRFTLPRLQNMEILKSAEKALADKKIKHLGFFFHDQYQFLRDIVQAYDNWTLCQFQYSLMDIDHHPGYGGLKYAADNGLAVVAAKPLLGGRLVNNIPPAVSKIWADAEPKRSPAEWALRWVWNHPEISTAVCDMESTAQVKEYAALADSATADSFSVPEELAVAKTRDAYMALRPIPCTACRGCMPSQGNCVQGIDVPRIFEIFNDAHMYHDFEIARALFNNEHHDLIACTGCGTCVCGKKIAIPDWLKKAQALLADNG
jgi:predicted aldo/keto reductase-like oxidoreductase